MNDQLIWNADGKKIYVCQFGELCTNTGIFINEKMNEAFVIDSPSGSYESLKNSILANVRVVALLITHGHWDHIGDDFLFKQGGARIYAHRGDQIMIEHPESMIPCTEAAVDLRPCKLDYAIDDREIFEMAGIEIKVYWVPGHSSGGVAFYLPCASIVFVGDTLFRDGIGRYDLFGGDRKSLVSCIKEKILTLPSETTVIPGHGPFTGVEYERANNKHLRAKI